MSAEDFAAFLARVRAGDEQAANELYGRYQECILREVRVRLRRRPAYVARVLGAEDVCQSVLASFFVRAALGQYDLREPAQLLQLLRQMARNKLAYRARREAALRRGGGRNVAEAGDDLPQDGTASPSRVAAGRELLAEVRRRLGDEERRVADLRGQGHEWAEIARQLGGTADGRRMQLARALDRVSRELGLEVVDD
jgi:RNA polymerase sigma-70 factor (ECF subfamily)